MADIIKGLFGGEKPSAVPASPDDDFADFAGAPAPEPASITSYTTSTFAPAGAPTSTVGQVPYTAWYRVWERASPADFKQEMYILPFIILVVAIHLWGTRSNRRKATHWMKSHAPFLESEYAQVGYIRPTDDAASKELLTPENMLREKKADEYTTYATGRQNVAFTDFRLTLLKRYNPLMRVGEAALSLFFDSLSPPEERMEATAYMFDGRESLIVPGFAKREEKRSVANSTYDGFVWAVVHKDLMKNLREARYDLSLTATKDHPKLPVWTTVMSESAEITESLLTPELAKAITEAGDKFEAFIISDQPMEQPRTLDDCQPRKRVSLSLKLQPSGAPYDSTNAIFNYFLRMPDVLVSVAHYRHEALRRIKQTREEQILKIKKLDDEEKSEERKLQSDKEKKAKRDALLSKMSAEEQRKYLEKERERDVRKRGKKTTVKG
ncbi:DUF1682-domain-containing protein [Delitschia confertaspora ATCC 74209]|uniref:DUF1682-domain-containing protein n=1 Tax=Delitschia confertaspora ATCC 74209 TaxID=1513339 RepID=A0A9P4JQ08_9PLEO|nr:DUF1682-domain-containing protein [Delitschia confertaspora ATCC 74209]